MFLQILSIEIESHEELDKRMNIMDITENIEEDK